jgi:hypothetical protein
MVSRPCARPPPKRSNMNKLQITTTSRTPELGVLAQQAAKFIRVARVSVASILKVLDF